MLRVFVSSWITEIVHKSTKMGYSYTIFRIFWELQPQISPPTRYTYNPNLDYMMDDKRARGCQGLSDVRKLSQKRDVAGGSTFVVGAQTECGSSFGSLPKWGGLGLKLSPSTSTSVWLCPFMASYRIQRISWVKDVMHAGPMTPFPHYFNLRVKYLRG